MSEAETSGIIFDIKRYAIHDGPGIRTTVFMKGCPLNCLWCHNPQSISPEPETAFYKNRCVHCGGCAEGCAFGARVQIGERRTAGQVMETVMKDAAYYARSGGGLTLSGGEPLMQPRFALELLKLAKSEGLHTCVDTSGYGAFVVLETLIPYTDLFLYDIKEMDAQKHMEFTGVDNTLIIENLSKLDAAGAETVIRCPLIPGLNDRKDHFDALKGFVAGLRHLQKIEILPFHPYGSDTAEAVGRAAPLKDKEAASSGLVAEWEAYFPNLGKRACRDRTNSIPVE